MAKHLKADLDDMVFEDRERNYGAYFLRKRYPAYLRIAVGTVAFIALCGSFGPLLAKSMGWIKGKVKGEVLVHEIKLSELPPPPPIEPMMNENPPAIIKLVMESVCVMLAIKPERKPGP